MKLRAAIHAPAAILLLSLLFAATPTLWGDEGPRLYPVVVGGKWGYIDNAGKLAIEPAFGAAFNFSEGLARVKAGEAIGYIDRTGRYLWEPTR